MENKQKIPQHLLEEINLGEVPAQKYYKKYGKENLEEELEKLRISDKEFYYELPVAKMPKRMNWIVTKGITIAACASALFIGVFNYFQNTKTLPSNLPTRIKGEEKTELFVYRQTGKEAELLQNNSVAAQGDTLQLAFNANQTEYVVIFSVDGNGNVTNHYPAESFTAKSVLKNAGTQFLDYSYELDDAPAYELFVMVTSENPFTIEPQFLQKLSLKQLQKGKYLPQNTEFTTFLLTK